MRRLILTITVFILFTTSCGGDDGGGTTAGDDTGADTGADDTAADTGADDTAATDTGDFDIASVEASVVKIASEGTFIDPQVGLQLNAAGVGTGFIISDDGLVVTNNHVVTGAALLRVFVPGEDEPVNARILGVSECSDLAVVDLDGDGYSALSFRSEPATAGLSVFAMGYPASDAATIEEVDFTMTGGIVSNLTASGETNWASVDEVLEHDARIRGGNSGGPLVDETGQVVAVNYAGIDESDQNYAITGADAQPIIDQLIEGNNVDSIGINGQAVADAEEGISGIWVASVESGSPADQAGIEAGDIVTSLENLVLGTDGTMSDYCDVIRTQGAEATMNVEVLRFATEEVLEGQINGEPLALSFSFAQEFDDQVAPDDPSGSLDTYAEYTTVSDDSELITVDVPAEWAETDGRVNDSFGPSIYAAPDLQGFLDTWTTPGIIVEASTDRGAAEIEPTLDEIDLSEPCVSEGREPYEDPLYAGTLEVWSNCGGVGTVSIVLAAAPTDGSFLIRALIQAVEPRDLDAADVALNTFVANMN